MSVDVKMNVLKMSKLLANKTVNDKPTSKETSVTKEHR